MQLAARVALTYAAAETSFRAVEGAFGDVDAALASVTAFAEGRARHCAEKGPHELVEYCSHAAERIGACWP